MLWLWILGILAALLLWLCLTRVGAQASFSGNEVQLDVRVGLFHFRAFPGKEKKKEPEEKPKQEKKPAEEKEKKDLGITVSDVREAVSALWPPLKRALRRTGRGIRIDPLCLSVTLGGEEDPAKTAQLYGELQAAVWTGMPVLERLVDIPDPRLHIGMDFCRAGTEVEGSAGLTLRIGTLLAAAFGVGIPALRWLLRFQKRKKQAQQPRKAAA